MIRFMFLRNANKQPVGCIAVNMSMGLLTYGLSVLNPLDKFDRGLARGIAEGRLNSSSAYRQILNGATLETMHDISKSVMLDLLINPHAPSRARKAARLWLTNNATR